MEIFHHSAVFFTAFPSDFVRKKTNKKNNHHLHWNKKYMRFNMSVLQTLLLNGKELGCCCPVFCFSPSLPLHSLSPYQLQTPPSPICRLQPPHLPSPTVSHKLQSSHLPSPTFSHKLQPSHLSSPTVSHKLQPSHLPSPTVSCKLQPSHLSSPPISCKLQLPHFLSLPVSCRL